MKMNEKNPLVGVPASNIGKTPLCRQLTASLSASFCSFTLGMMLGYSSPAIPKLIQQGRLAGYQGAWFGSLLLLGAAFGGIIGGFLVHFIGRKRTIIYGVLPSAVGWLLIICGANFRQLYAGRILTGLSLGISSVAVPIYIAEISSKEYRGSLGSLQQLMVVTGILFVYTLGIWLSAELVAVLSLLLSSVYIILMLFMPESPRWLLQNHHEDKAREALTWLRGRLHSISIEYHEIKSLVDAVANKQTYFTFHKCMDPKIYRPLIISTGLMIGQQIGGINVVTLHVESIFASAGLTGAMPSVIVGAVQFFFTLFAALIVDKIGRKPLLMISNIFMMASSLTFGTYYYVDERGSTLNWNWLPLVSLSLYMVGFSVGMGPIPVLIMSEVLPVYTRGIATIAGSFLGWIFAFIVAAVLPFLFPYIGTYGAFWIFGILSFGVAIFVFFVVIETKCKSLEELEINFENPGESYGRL